MITQHDLFERFKQGAFVPGYRWKHFWHDIWHEQIDEYIKMNWHLIKLVHHAKDPYYGSHGSRDEALTGEQAMACVEAGDNLGCVLHDKVVIDIDTMQIGSLAKMIERTRTSETIRGYHFYTQGPLDKRRLAALRSQYPFVDTARTDFFFTLLPYSIATKKNTLGPPGVYQWLSVKPLMQFSEFVQEALSLGS